MRLDRLKIDGFKNLNNVEIDFDEDELSTVLIGLNGTDKSNVLEALVIIFRSLDLREPIPFRCYLRYQCQSKWIEVDNRWSDPATPLRILADDKAVSASRVAAHASEYLPSNVFGYYSGGTLGVLRSSSISTRLDTTRALLSRVRRRKWILANRGYGGYSTLGHSTVS
jgi:hypothetical protein